MSHDDVRTRRHLTVSGWFAGAAVVSLALLAGSSMSKFEPTSTAARSVEVWVTAEDDTPIGGATISFDAGTVRTDREGRAELRVEHPVVAVASHDRFLDEPFAVHPGDNAVTLRLWARQDDGGRERTSIHFGGDVMLGRRYLDENRATPYVEDAASARRVVTELGTMAAAADTTIVNLETVIGDLPDEEALPAKRFLIKTSPLVSESLDELGVDLVTLGNNHAYDWGEGGLEATTDALDAAGVLHVGAGDDQASATRGRIVDSAGLRLGIVSATSVTGDYVNDNLPSPEAAAPPDLPPDDLWQYEERLFGLRHATRDDVTIADTQVPLRPIRIAEAWEIVESAEEHLSRDDADATWKLVFAAFPELQDWVARRGHGGAAPYRADRIADEIARLRSDGADVVVVQLHGGFQFAPVESAFIRRASQRAIDAGADAVVSHHPHVLQGVEWYRGGLVVYSLGNLVFDQDFHSTFPSALLRIVTDGDDILEARLLPVVIDRYRPTPLSGDAARDVVGMVAARSGQSATSTRFGEHVRVVLDESSGDDDGSDPSSLRFDRNSGLIERVAARDRDHAAQLGAGGVGTLPPCSTVRADLLADDVEVADDLLWWGSFDRTTTAADRKFPVGWLIPSDHDRWRTVDGDPLDPSDRAIELTTAPNSTTTLRVAALVDTPTHRLFDADGLPLDPLPDLEVRMRMRRERGEPPVLRLTSYARHDTDPTVDPYTARLHQVEIPLDVSADGRWHELSVPVPRSLTGVDTDVARALGIAILLPPAHLGTFTVDDVELLEWRRRTPVDQPVWVPASRVRTRNGAGQQPGAVDLMLRTC